MSPDSEALRSDLSNPSESLEECVSRFERAWQAGQRPAVEDYLPEDSRRRLAALVELAHADLEYRLKAGEPARADDYLGRFPELAGDTAAAVGLIVAEWEQRRRRELGLDPAEYRKRFPQWGEELSRRLQTPLDSTASLVASLRESQLLEPAQLDELAPSTQGGSADVHVFAEHLVGRGWLTPYQADQALLGQATDLLLGPYLILEKLGQGGLGEVYKARHRGLGRLVV